MKSLTYEEYLKMTNSELRHKYLDYYKVCWPNRPENVEIDENLFEAISYKLRQGK